jgi:DNA-directed RNA polymerase beta subunit
MAEAPKRISNTLLLKDQLQEKQAELQFDDKVMGLTLLTNPGYISSSRSIMFTLHMKQFVNLNHPEFPRVFTNYENMVGRHSTNYRKAKNELTVIEKVPRFIEAPNHLYSMFTYDKKNDMYDVIEKRCVENLTEKFGFAYNNDTMDGVNEGDIIKEDEVLYKSLSYDEDMNYCYGLNANVIYLLENHTIEDAAVCSESMAKKLTSKEVETVTVSLNDNDVFCNLYGDKEEYKCFPDIGELVKEEVVCAKRRIHTKQILHDLKKTNLRKMNHTSDIPYFSSGKILDIMIFSNKLIEELEDNDFNRQLLTYLRNQTRYYTRVFEICDRIVNSSSKCSDMVKYLYKRSREVLDPVYKWKVDDGTAFGHMMIQFLVERDVALTIGAKISGTSGDKSVVSKILPDDEMPYVELADGTKKRVDFILNSLGVVNRLNSWQLYQVSINFVCNRVREKLYTMSTLKEKEVLLFDIVGRFNTEQVDRLKIYYKKLSSKDKKDFFANIHENGIYIHVPPLWEKEQLTLFDRLNNIYKDYPWIERYTVYVNRFGRKIPMLNKLVLGEKYIIKMKQTSKKGFSGRSTGSISKQGVPSKSSKAKVNLESWSHTPIRVGIDENINTCIGVDSDVIANLHLSYRSSAQGRKELSKQLATNLNTLEDFITSPEFKNRNVEILQAYFKCLGYELVFEDQYYKVKSRIKDIKTKPTSNGKMFIGAEYEFDEYERGLEIKAKNPIFAGTRAQYEKFIQDEIDKERKLEKYYVIKTKKPLKKIEEKE